MTSAQQPDNAINLLREPDIPGRTKVPVSFCSTTNKEGPQRC